MPPRNIIDPLPDIVDIQVVIRVGQPLSNGRKEWENPIQLKFQLQDGFHALKGMIERKVHALILPVTQGNRTLYQHVKPKTDPSKRPVITNVRRWTRHDGLYLQTAITSAQKDYELLDSDEDLTRGITTAWSNSFKGQGKTTRNRIRLAYEEELNLFEANPSSNPRPELPVYYYFKFFIYCIPDVDTPAQFRATADRLETARNRIETARNQRTFGDDDSELREGEMTFTSSNYARTPMIDPPRRLTSQAARQFHRLDKVKRKQINDFNELYPDGATWTSIKMFLGGAVINVPVDIECLREALGLPPTDLRLMGHGLTNLVGVEEAGVDGIQNMPDVDHDSENEFADTN